MSGDWNGAADEEEERWTVQLRMQQTAEYSAGNSYKVEERRNQQEKIKRRCSSGGRSTGASVASISGASGKRNRKKLAYIVFILLLIIYDCIWHHVKRLS